MPLSSREHEALVALAEKEGRETESSLGSQWPAPMTDAAFIGPSGDFARIVEPYTESDLLAFCCNFWRVWAA
jgi:hypothetical protein